MFLFDNQNIDMNLNKVKNGNKISRDITISVTNNFWSNAFAIRKAESIAKIGISVINRL